MVRILNLYIAKFVVTLLLFCIIQTILSNKSPLLNKTFQNFKTDYGRIENARTSSNFVNDLFLRWIKNNLRKTMLIILSNMIFFLSIRSLRLNIRYELHTESDYFM